MRIDQLRIQNFRNIGDETTYSFNANFTVVIGVNGKGKSTILHALRIACGAFFLSIPDVKKRHITPDEIRVVNLGQQLVPQRPVKIEATGFFPIDDADNFAKILIWRRQILTWRRQILENSNSTTSNEQDIGEIKRIGKVKYDTSNLGQEGALPVIAFFGTSRAHGAGRNRGTRLGRQIFKDGYQDWYEMKSSTFKYEDWLSTYEVFKEENKEYPHTKDAFFETIKIANPYITTIKDVNGRLWLKVKINDFESDLLPIHLHSDGIRFFTEMVAELAYRCIVLNGFRDVDAIKLSRGVVMIDEIDLHLHPNWQKQVVGNLKQAFPKIQFIATSHSPFIVQSLAADELINLDTDVIGLDESPNRYSLEEVSEEVMGIENAKRSQTFIEMQSLAEEYFNLIKNKSDADSIAKAKVKLDELRIKFSNDPAYVALLNLKML